MILPLYATLDSLDYSLIEAAQDLGANKFKVFTRIIFPYSLPGVISGSIMVFMLSIGTYIVPKVLGGKSSVWFVELIYGNFIETLNWEQGSAFAFILLILSELLLRKSAESVDKNVGIEKICRRCRDIARGGNGQNHIKRNPSPEKPVLIST